MILEALMVGIYNKKVILRITLFKIKVLNYCKNKQAECLSK